MPTRSIVDEFAASNQAFYDTFIPAWVKMQELGLTSTLQVQTSLGNMAPPLFHINEIPLRVAANPAKCVPAGCKSRLQHPLSPGRQCRWQRVFAPVPASS